MLIAQISDTHIGEPGSRVDQRYRTAEHLERAVAHLMGLAERPDAVMLSGDCVDTGSIAEYTRLRTLLQPLTMPVHLVAGNHDDPANLGAVFGDHGARLEGEFLQYTVRYEPLHLVVLDTHVPGQPSGMLCDARLRWLEDRLAEDADAPTLVFAHHPPFRTGMKAMDVMGLSSSDGLGAIVGRHPNVERVLSGHIHRPAQFRFHGTIAQTCPSTAHQLELTLGEDESLSMVMEPPACLLHRWSDGLGLVTHTSYIASFGPPEVLFDGESWTA